MARCTYLCHQLLTRILMAKVFLHIFPGIELSKSIIECFPAHVCNIARLCGCGYFYTDHISKI